MTDTLETGRKKEEMMMRISGWSILSRPIHGSCDAMGGWCSNPVKYQKECIQTALYMRCVPFDVKIKQEEK